MDAPNPPEPRKGPTRAEREREAETLRGWYALAGVGIEFVVAVGLFAGLGWLLDGWLGMRPWGVIAGAFLGFGVGMYLLVRAAGKFSG